MAGSRGNLGAPKEEEEGQVRQRGHWFIISVFQSCCRWKCDYRCRSIAHAAVGGKAEVLSAVLWFCSLADPYDQAVITADEVKEEEPEPFQKIGPSKSCYCFE